MIAKIDLDYINETVHDLDIQFREERRHGRSLLFPGQVSVTREEGRLHRHADVDALRETAAENASVCADCFRRLSPRQPATMTTRNVGSRTAPRWLYVPICRRCANRHDRDRARRGAAALYRPPTWEDTRCLNRACRRPIRVCERACLATKTCCAACERRARYDRNNLRRRVPLYETTRCAACTRRFVRTRADARFCRNACRQSAHRRRRRTAPRNR